MQTTTPVAPSSELQEVAAVIEKEKTAMTSGDCSLYFSVLAEDAVFYPPNTTAKSGTELRSWLAEFLSSFSVEWIRWSQGDIVMSGEVAYYDYLYCMKSTPRLGGEPVIGNGKGLEVLRRKEDGLWLIVRNIWNSVPKPVEP